MESTSTFLALNQQSIMKNKEPEKYSPEYFKYHGSIGGKKSTSKLSKDELSKRGKRLARARWDKIKQQKKDKSK